MSSTGVDLQALRECSREPIHIPGAIQPHGALIVLEEGTLRCLQVSTNIQEFTGWEIEHLVNVPLTDAVPGSASALHTAMSLQDPLLASPIVIETPAGNRECLLHRHAGVLILELERLEEGVRSHPHRHFQTVFQEMRAAEDANSLYRVMAAFVAELTGYERVMVYRFDEDWHGEVVGEHLLTEVDSYLGHHFPASDIPEQARALYTKSWLRIIPNSSYTPVPLSPQLNPLTDKPTDLSFSVLRSVSPIHLEYLRNMDVGASMSISLIIQGRLWGLIACHHRDPRPLPHALRAACEIFGQVASLEIASNHESRRLREHVEATRIQTRFFDIISKEKNFVEAMVKYTPDLLDFMEASGAAIYVNGAVTLMGRTPGKEQVASLISWLEEQQPNPIFLTDALSTLYPEAQYFTAQASGIMALKISHVEANYLIWFRPEVISTVTWAGNPNKAVEPGQSLHPRKSFAAWKQKVTGHSTPWKETERQGALELRAAVNALVLRRNEQLLRDNVDLERKNTDLNSFAYIASHDLREPLRGIAQYSAFVLEDHEPKLPEDAKYKLKTIGTLALQCEELLDALSHFSRIGRMDLQIMSVSLDTVLDKVLTSLQIALEQAGMEVRRPVPLPTVKCDPVMMREVFHNLITNAIRYNDSTTKWVEIGPCAAEDGPQSTTIYVRDNGIGIKPKHFESIFIIFRRLHADGTYGNGSGAGLAITRSIIERHGGRIWVESEPGTGSTFYFTLS